MDMQLQHLFTTPIVEIPWDEDTNILYRLKVSLENKNICFLQNDTAESIFFTKWIVQKSREYALALGNTQGVVGVRDIWYRTLKNQSGYVPPHSHPSTWCVGTFYFEEGQGDLVLIDPRGSIEFETAEHYDNEGNVHSNCLDFYYTPKPNTAIMFPAYLKHLVLPSKQTKRSRTAISWNTMYLQDTRFIDFIQPPEHTYESL